MASQSLRSRILDLANNFSKRHPVASTTLQLGAAGAGAAAMVSLVRDLKTAIDERKKRDELENDSIGADTIVLRVPKRGTKAAEDGCAEHGGECADPEVCRAQESSHDKVSRRQALVTKEMHVGSHPTDGFQRDVHGQFTDAGTKSAETGALDRTAQVVGGVGAAAAGYVLVRKLHDRLEQRRLRRQIEAAQQEYLSLIDGKSTKHASADSVFLIGDPAYECAEEEKTAGVVHDIASIPKASKNLTAAALASYIMMALGTGYVTKRVLQNKFDADEPEEEAPKVNRVIFKSASGDFEIDPGAALATIGVLASCIQDSDDPMSKSAADYRFLDKVTSTPEGKQWLLDVYAKGQGLKRNVSETEIPNLGAMGKLNYARTLLGIRRNPERHMPAIRGHVMQLVRSDPKAWFSLLGGKRNSDLVSHVATNALLGGLSRGEFGAFASLPVVRQLLGGMGSLALKTQAGRNAALGRAEKALSQKAAQDFSQLSEMLANHKIMSDKKNVDLDRKLDQILENLPVKRKRKPKAVPHETLVAAEKGDEDADEFVMRNGEQIARILNGMKQKGLVA